MKAIKKGTIARIVVFAVIIAILYILPSMKFSNINNILRILLQVAMYCTLGQMWNFMSGYTGMTSLGHQLFIGLSGYSVAVFTAMYKLPFWMGMIFGGLVSTMVSMLLSALLFRMKGMYFAIATWVTAEAMAIVFSAWKYVKSGSGMTIMVKPYPSTSDIYLMAVTLAILAILVVYLVLNSRTGLGLTAMRDDSDAAASVGVNIFRSRLTCYMISAFITGLVGSLFYLYQGTIFPNQGFGITWTIAAVFIVIIGGIGTISGPILGAAIYVALDEFLSKYTGWSMIILGAIAILVIHVMPNGVLGTLERKFGFEILSSRRHLHDLESVQK